MEFLQFCRVLSMMFLRGRGTKRLGDWKWEGMSCTIPATSAVANT